MASKQTDVYEKIEYHFVKSFILLLLLVDIGVILFVIGWHVYHLVMNLCAH